MSEKLWVHVCVWDPKHTAAISHAQISAVSDGTIAKLAKKHGPGSKELKEALVKKKLVTMTQKGDDLHCTECDSLMDRLLAKPGITERHQAIEEIAENFDAAIDRSRDAR
jgi:hypothetical protein